MNSEVFIQFRSRTTMEIVAEAESPGTMWNIERMFIAISAEFGPCDWRPCYLGSRVLPWFPVPINFGVHQFPPNLWQMDAPTHGWYSSPTVPWW